jgi:hypothetical protein
MLTSLGDSQCCELATVRLPKALQPCNTTVANQQRKRRISATPSSVIVGMKGSCWPPPVFSSSSLVYEPAKD